MKKIKYLLIFIISLIAQHIAISLILIMLLHNDPQLLYWDLTAGAFISYAVAYEEYIKDNDEKRSA